MSVPAQARLAGALYLVIIAAGVWGEAVARGGTIVPGDAEATARAIRDGGTMFRAALLADLLMALCDAGVAVLLFLLLRPLAPAAALAAMVFRLVQTSVVAANMLVTAAALAAAGEAAGLATALMDLRGARLRYRAGLLRHLQRDPGRDLPAPAGAAVGSGPAASRQRRGLSGGNGPAHRRTAAGRDVSARLPAAACRRDGSGALASRPGRRGASARGRRRALTASARRAYQGRRPLAGVTA